MDLGGLRTLEFAGPFSEEGGIRVDTTAHRHAVQLSGFELNAPLNPKLRLDDAKFARRATCRNTVEQNCGIRIPVNCSMKLYSWTSGQHLGAASVSVRAVAASGDAVWFGDAAWPRGSTSASKTRNLKVLDSAWASRFCSLLQL